MLPTGSPNNRNNTGRTVSYTDIKERIPTDQKSSIIGILFLVAYLVFVSVYENPMIIFFFIHF